MGDFKARGGSLANFFSNLASALAWVGWAEGVPLPVKARGDSSTICEVIFFPTIDLAFTDFAAWFAFAFTATVIAVFIVLLSDPDLLFVVLTTSTCGAEEFSIEGTTFCSFTTLVFVFELEVLID